MDMSDQDLIERVIQRAKKGMDLPDLNRLPLAEIARVISQNWPKVNYGARPYLDAMASMSDISDNYGQDPGTSIVAYFLSNATSWRGPVAKEVKKELNKRLKRAR